nr:hypothetical protein [Tanacetum cinerariifolium]
MEEEIRGAEVRDVGAETHEGPTKPVLQAQKTPSFSPPFIKENIDVLKTMIKEHDQQAKTKAMPRRLAYADSDKEAMASKNQRTPSKNKELAHPRRSRRLEDRCITKDKTRRKGPSPEGKDRRAIPEYLTWRHSCSCVSNDLPSDGYDQNDVQRLCARLNYLQMSIYDFITLLSWSDAKIVEESHHLSFPLLERVPSYTSAPASKGAIIPLPTPDEIAASLLDSRLAKKSKGSSQASLKSKKEEAAEKSFESWCFYEGCLSPIPRLGKRLGAPPSIVVVSVSKPSYVGTSAPASTSCRSLSLRGDVASGRVGKSKARMGEDDDFGTATYGEEIDLTLFPIALGPYHMPYSYEGVLLQRVLDQTITPDELRRTKSLLPLELSNYVNVLTALLVSHSYELNSCYANLVSSKAYLQEKFDKKKGDVKLLHSKVTSLDSKLENLQREQVLTIRDLQNKLALERSKSQGCRDAMDGLKEETDLDKALDDFPNTYFPFLSKIVMASEGSLSDVAQILPDKFVRLATLVVVAPSSASEASEQVPP